MPADLWLLVSLCCGAPGPQSPPQAPAGLTDVVDVASAGAYVGGAIAAFVAHETGHVAMNYALGNAPSFVGVTGFGFVPFFAISPDLACDTGGCLRRDGNPFGPGRRGMYLISTAGFTVQHIGNEIVLSTDPHLRCHTAPWRKGLLSFNVLLSLGYGLASMLSIEDPHGDAGGAARVAGLSPFVFSPMLMLPALLDTYRFLYPEALWATWLSRGSKAAMLGLAFTF